MMPQPMLIWKTTIKEKPMLKNNLPPIHPGAYIKAALPEAGFNQAELADILDCSKSYVSDIIKGRRGLTVKMCFELAEVLGSSPEFWARLQSGYDMKKAERDRSILAAIRHVRHEMKAVKARKLEEQHA
jgi:addiction module HigA family antidote